MIPEVVASPDAVPAAELERRFGGLERLYGVAGAARIRQAHVAVIGVGGVGSWTAEALARSGWGRSPWWTWTMSLSPTSTARSTP